ncbi:hypothetical protein [Rhodococcus gannanensis]|uniref:Uncharacterized protein n=1 Tax=Rhodococcus gannanensis TaxID=1960308 RepID=A0ABW4P0W2_9NOCA
MADKSTPILSAAFVFALLTATACATERDGVEDAPPQQPAPPLYSTVWSADAGTDLFGRPGELIRATSEAAEFSTYAGSGHSYPGYVDALNTSREAPNPGIDPILLSVTGSPQRPVTFVRHIVEMESGPHSVAATVCGFTVQPTPGENYSMNPLRRPIRIGLRNPTSDAGAPGQEDSDPLTTAAATTRTPTWNVFEGWSIEEITLLEDEDIPEACVDWWQGKFPEFTRKPGGNILFPPPGYVYPTAPVAAQYPEWIPPSGDN